jgi:hypothetical protein
VDTRATAGPAAEGTPAAAAAPSPQARTTPHQPRRGDRRRRSRGGGAPEEEAPPRNEEEGTPTRMFNDAALESVRRTVEAALVENAEVTFAAPPSPPMGPMAELSVAAATEFTLRSLRFWCGTTGPVGKLTTYLGTSYYDELDVDDLRRLRAALFSVDVYPLLDVFDGPAPRVAPSLVTELRTLGARVNFLIARLDGDVSARVSRAPVASDMLPDAAGASSSSSRARTAAQALKPGVGDTYHGPSAHPPVDVYEYLCSVDAIFTAADASAEVPLTDAQKCAHVISLLRGPTLIDFKTMYALACVSYPLLKTWALHDESVYDFTAFFVDVHTTLDERERAAAAYQDIKRKGYFADPGTIARTLVRKRARVGNGPATPAHLRISAGALLADFLALLPAEMVARVFADNTFASLNGGVDVAPPAADVAAAEDRPFGLITHAVALATPHDTPADALVLRALNRAVAVAMVVYKAAVSASSAASAAPRRASLRALLPGAPPEDAVGDTHHTAALLAAIARLDDRVASLAAADAGNGGGGGAAIRAPSPLPSPSTDEDEATLVASLAQRNYNALRKQELRGTPATPRPPMRCFKCGEEGHGWRDCPKPGDNFVTPLRLASFRSRRGGPPPRDRFTVAKHYVNRSGRLTSIELQDEDIDELDDEDVVYSTTADGELFVIT